MAGWIVVTTVLAAAATFTLGWRVARRRFLGRALDAERQYRALEGACPILQGERWSWDRTTERHFPLTGSQTRYRDQ